MNAKPLCIRFNKINEFIKTHNGIRCLVLFDYGWLDNVIGWCDYAIGLGKKMGIIVSINHNLGKTRIDLYNSLPIGKILTF